MTNTTETTNPIIDDWGNKRWYKNGKRHRDDGPAFEGASGDKEWYQNGKRHRDDGPAIEWPDGCKEYWINGVKQDEENYNG
jgi:hypothetical protein